MSLIQLGIFYFAYRQVHFGGKGSTEFVVKGSHKEVPLVLIDELSAICGVSDALLVMERYL